MVDLSGLGKTLILILFSVAVIWLSSSIIIFRKNNVKLEGKIPINKKVFIIGKSSIVISWFALIAQASNFDIRIFTMNPILEIITLILLIIAFSILFVSLFNLGSSLRMGLPTEKTTLRTNGFYKFSRNPIYIFYYLATISSVLYTLNPIILIFAIVGILIHHKIVIAEEKFLSKTFGKKYHNYCEITPRYLL